MATFKKIQKDFDNLTNKLWNIEDIFKALVSERETAISRVINIIDQLNDPIFNICCVTFNKPIEIDWICDGEVLTSAAISIQSDFDYYIVTEDNEISLDKLTADSLERIIKGMEKGTWEACRANSDDEYEEITVEELRTRREIEENKIYNLRSNHE